MNDLTVSLGERTYKIFVGENLSESVVALAKKYRNEKRPVALITFPAFARMHPEFFSKLEKESTTTLFTSIDGENESLEEAKSSSELSRIWEALAQAKLDRSSAIFAVGGGVVGDLAGFVAATFLRGIDFVQVPTTLLAMVDSAVGGKTGINLRAGKNLVGAFYQPRAVFADVQLLSTLPKREFAAGMAEVAKYGMLGDAKFFDELEAAGKLAWNSPTLPQIIRRCCEIKAQIVAEDERETTQENGRALLNLGHTFGHTIEKVAGYGRYRHGEGVAIGLVASAKISEKLGFAGEGTLVERTMKILQTNDLPTKLHEPLPIDVLMATMGSDKKVRAGTQRFVLLNAIGKSFTFSDVPESLVESTWRELM